MKNIRATLLKAASYVTGSDRLKNCLQTLDQLFDLRQKMRGAECSDTFSILVRNDESNGSATFIPVESITAARKLIDAMPQQKALGFWIEYGARRMMTFEASFPEQGVETKTRAQWLEKKSSFSLTCNPTAIVEQVRQEFLKMGGLSHGDKRKIAALYLLPTKYPPRWPRPE